ncbi:MAG: hypothetical protein ACK456_15095 [Pseudanabaenaceae cyanobacterium]|jgi:hypothetical protein
MKSLQKISLALMAAVTVGGALPAFAGDTAVIQDNNQTTVITGNGNSVTNRSTQTNIGVRNGRRTGGDTGVVQRNNQVTDVAGDNNTVRNTNRQTNVDVRNNGRVRIRLPR